MRGLFGSFINLLVRFEFWCSRRYWILRTSGVGEFTKIYRTVRIRAPRSVTLGRNCVINDYVHMWGAGGITIGDDTMVAAGTIISSQSHEVDALSKGQLYRETTVNRPVAIGSNVWIASNVIVGPGVTIGRGAVVGAGSVVLHDVPAGVLVAGNPARVIRRLV